MVGRDLTGFLTGDAQDFLERRLEEMCGRVVGHALDPLVSVDPHLHRLVQQDRSFRHNGHVMDVLIDLPRLDHLRTACCPNQNARVAHLPTP